MAGQVAARRSRIEAREAERARLTETIATSLQRAAKADEDFAALETTVADDEAGEEGLDSTYEDAAARLAQATAAVEHLRTQEREAGTAAAAAKARVDALELSLRRKDGAATLLAAATDGDGLLGSVASLLQVRGGHEAAIAAALGPASDAVGARRVQDAAAIPPVTRCRTMSWTRPATLPRRSSTCWRRSRSCPPPSMHSPWSRRGAG